MPGSPEDRPIPGPSGPPPPVPRTGGGPGTLLHVPARLDACAEVRAFVRGRAAELGADETATTDLVQAVDEWVTNVVVHGYRGSPGPVDVELERDAASIIVRVSDLAPVFDPGVAPRFDPSVPLERRRLGGMGIYLMRDLMDSIEHRPLPGGGNEVTMRRHCRTRARRGSG